MRKYLATLHEKPDHHKKRFAFLVSGGFALLIFSIWTLVMFGDGGVLATREEVKKEEVSPLGTLRAGAAEGFDGIKDNFNNLIDIYGR